MADGQAEEQAVADGPAEVQAEADEQADENGCSEKGKDSACLAGSLMGEEQGLQQQETDDGRHRQWPGRTQSWGIWSCLKIHLW